MRLGKNDKWLKTIFKITPIFNIGYFRPVRVFVRFPGYCPAHVIERYSKSDIFTGYKSRKSFQNSHDFQNDGHFTNIGHFWPFRIFGRFSGRVFVWCGFEWILCLIYWMKYRWHHRYNRWFRFVVLLQVQEMETEMREKSEARHPYPRYTDESVPFPILF